MNVMIIGGAGYIGSHVARALLDEGAAVTVYDNLSTGAVENLFPEAAFIKGDILDIPTLSAALEGGFDAIVHLAALKAAGESMTAPEKYSLTNIGGSINIFNAAIAAGVKAIVFSSSAAVYGEPRYTPIDEQHPREPVNYYGYTKLQIEGILSWYFRLKGLSSCSLRYFNAAGYDERGRVHCREKNPANLLPLLMETAAGLRDRVSIFGTDYPTADGTCIRDYVHVTDLAAAHVLAVRHLLKQAGCLAVNLGSDRGCSVKEMLTVARRITGRPIPAELAPRRAGDPAIVLASSALAFSLWGWQARFSDVENLVASTWRMYQKNDHA